MAQHSQDAGTSVLSTVQDWFNGSAKIPVGQTADQVFSWLKTNARWFFDGMSDVMEALIDAVLWVLQGPAILRQWGVQDLYPFLVIAGFVGLTWALQRSWKTCLLVLLGFLFILNQGYWKETTESLALVLSACVVCMGLGVPVGIWLAHRPRAYQFVSPVLDLMQTLPTFVYLIPAIIFFGLGMVPGLIATVIFVLPAPIRLTYLGVSTTPQPLLEAATAFGATPRQTLYKVELPYALPQIMAGLNQTIMLSLSMVVIAAYVGADGLGQAGGAGAQPRLDLAWVRVRLHHRRRRHRAGPDAALGETQMSVAVEFDRVSIVFGDHPERALPLMDEGRTRAEVQEATGQILGVHDCSLTVEAGEILVLMGLSGSGKSTLLRAVNGLNPVVRGAVTVHDEDWSCDVVSAPRAELLRVRRECVGMVFQQFGLLPWRTVRDNVGLGLEIAGQNAEQRRAKVDEQLALVGLSDWADRKVGELSGGMQQRVGLARAFATDAPILLMDEPFSALDPLIRSRLQDELLEVQAKLKRTIIFVSHDLDEAFKIGNRIALMEGGRIVQCGTARQIFSQPASPYVADFVAHMNPMGVLTARDVMEPGDTSGAPGVDPDLAVREVMARLRDEAELSVSENGKSIGKITRGGVMARLLDPRG